MFLPRLETQNNLKTIIGERDFGGGCEIQLISGVIVDCRKVVVLLSREIFDETLREFEVNMAIMHELYHSKAILLPVFIEEVRLYTFESHYILYI